MRTLTLREIQANLYYEVAKSTKEMKGQIPSKLITYIRWAFKNRLRRVPLEYREFAQLTKHWWPTFEKIESEDEQVVKLKELVDEFVVLNS